jgi:hypothetical protein
MPRQALKFFHFADYDLLRTGDSAEERFATNPSSAEIG